MKVKERSDGSSEKLEGGSARWISIQIEWMYKMFNDINNIKR